MFDTIIHYLNGFEWLILAICLCLIVFLMNAFPMSRWLAQKIRPAHASSGETTKMPESNGEGEAHEQ